MTHKLVGAGGEDIAGQVSLEMLGALRGAVDQQDGRRRRDHVDDADQRLGGMRPDHARVKASSTAANSVKPSE